MDLARWATGSAAATLDHLLDFPLLLERLCDYISIRLGSSTTIEMVSIQNLFFIYLPPGIDGIFVLSSDTFGHIGKRVKKVRGN